MDAVTILSALNEAAPGSGCELAPSSDQPTLYVPRAGLVASCLALRDTPGFSFGFLSDVTAVDWWPSEPRFEVVYHLASFGERQRLRLKVRLAGDDARVPTVSNIWPAAGWLEREVWDLFGIVFDGHTDLRRLLMPEDWEGHPLRKDYPVQIKMTPKVHEPLQLTQEEFRKNLEADRVVREDKG